jgi:hypothetical protein
MALLARPEPGHPYQQRPVTAAQWKALKLLDMSTDIRAFIAANEAQLKAKD